MSTVRAYYDGTAFVPFEPLDMPKGKVVDLSIAQDDTMSPEIAKKLAAFKRLTGEIHELNKTEPLPADYDEIMSRRVNFTRDAGHRFFWIKS